MLRIRPYGESERRFKEVFESLDPEARLRVVERQIETANKQYGLHLTLDDFKDLISGESPQESLMERAVERDGD